MGTHGVRQGIGLALVLAIAIVAVAGAAHASHDAVHDADSGAPCTVCDATLAVCGAALPAPAPTLAAVERAEPPVPDVLPVQLVSEPGRVAAPRGPPARS
jgi:hypothetical protein